MSYIARASPHKLVRFHAYDLHIDYFTMRQKTPTFNKAKWNYWLKDQSWNVFLQLESMFNDFKSACYMLIHHVIGDKTIFTPNATLFSNSKNTTNRAGTENFWEMRFSPTVHLAFGRDLHISL